MALLPNFVPCTWQVTNQGNRTEREATPAEMGEYLSELNADPYSTWGSTAEPQPTMMQKAWSLLSRS